MREVASAAAVATQATMWASPKFGMLIEKRIVTRATVV
jgi:hypothetical protein